MKEKKISLNVEFNLERLKENCKKIEWEEKEEDYIYPKEYLYTILEDIFGDGVIEVVDRKNTLNHNERKKITDLIKKKICLSFIDRNLFQERILSIIKGLQSKEEIITKLSIARTVNLIMNCILVDIDDSIGEKIEETDIESKISLRYSLKYNLDVERCNLDAHIQFAIDSIDEELRYIFSIENPNYGQFLYMFKGLYEKCTHQYTENDLFSIKRPGTEKYLVDYGLDLISINRKVIYEMDKKIKENGEVSLDSLDQMVNEKGEALSAEDKNILIALARFENSILRIIYLYFYWQRRIRYIREHKENTKEDLEDTSTELEKEPRLDKVVEEIKNIGEIVIKRTKILRKRKNALMDVVDRLFSKNMPMLYKNKEEGIEVPQGFFEIHLNKDLLDLIIAKIEAEESIIDDISDKRRLYLNSNDPNTIFNRISPEQKKYVLEKLSYQAIIDPNTMTVSFIRESTISDGSILSWFKKNITQRRILVLLCILLLAVLIFYSCTLLHSTEGTAYLKQKLSYFTTNQLNGA